MSNEKFDIGRLQEKVTAYKNEYNDLTGDSISLDKAFKVIPTDKIHTNDRSQATNQSRGLRPGGSGDGGLDGWYFAEESKTLYLYQAKYTSSTDGVTPKTDDLNKHANL